MPRVAGLMADEYIAQIADHALASDWRVEATRNNRLKFLGPNGEGPVYTQLRCHSPRDVDNALRQLVRAGLPAGEEPKHKPKETPAVLTVVKEETAVPEPASEPEVPTVDDELANIITEFTMVNNKAVEKLTVSLNARLLELRKARVEAAEWEELAQQQAEAVERMTAERDTALGKARAAEQKLQAILAPMRAALAGD